MVNLFQIKDLKEKVIDSTDKSKSSERRAKELEDILNVSIYINNILFRIKVPYVLTVDLSPFQTAKSVQ